MIYDFAVALVLPELFTMERFVRKIESIVGWLFLAIAVLCGLCIFAIPADMPKAITFGFLSIGLGFVSLGAAFQCEKSEFVLMLFLLITALFFIYDWSKIIDLAPL